eukprot:COSAG01_NODE_12725_length_1693_cov_2.590966_1_plen_470_part_01
MAARHLLPAALLAVLARLVAGPHMHYSRPNATCKVVGCSAPAKGSRCPAGSQPFLCESDMDCAGFGTCGPVAPVSCVPCASKACKHAACGVRGAHAGSDQVCVSNVPCHPPPIPPPAPPPPGYANATVTRVPVMVAGAKAMGCTSPALPPATEACVYKAFRIPGFVNAGGTLLAFAEGRATGCADMSGYHDMMQRSSTDLGRTWGALRTIVDARTLWRGFSAAHGVAVWDPTPLYDKATGTTFLFFGGPGRTLGHHWDIWQMKSLDKGEHWSEPVNMSSACGRQGDGSSKACCGLAGDTPSDGVGVQLSTGRLVIPMYGGKPAGRTICWSDDHGAQWHVAHTPGEDATEGEIAELFPPVSEGAAAAAAAAAASSTPPPHLLYTIRNTSCTRAVSKSTDAGLSWSPVTRAPQPMNEDPGCKGGITRWEGGRALVFANAGTCEAARIDTTVRLSLDNGRTWPHAQLIDKDSG